MRAVQYSRTMGFLPYCIDITKYLPIIFYNQNPNRKVVNEVLRLKLYGSEKLLFCFLLITYV